MVTGQLARPWSDDVEGGTTHGQTGTTGGGSCGALEITSSSTAPAVRCAHTRWRWLSVAMLLLIWACASWVHQRHSGNILDHLARRFQLSAAGEIISVHPGDDTGALYGAPPLTEGQLRPRAAFVVLARSQDVDDVVVSMTRLLARYNNSATQYPWVFLDNGELDENFRQMTSAAAAGPTRYGTIPVGHWSYPPWIPTWAAAKARDIMKQNHVLYGARESYHHMCRFFSGFFMLHPLLAEIDYYWRVEPDVHFYCDMPYDPFQFMRHQGIKYGFTLAVLEGRKTVPTLWDTTRDFMQRRPELVPADNLLDFVVAPDGDYNLCHFWSNFEMGDLRWFRSKQYQAYFEHLDRAGGFYYERWGDAPVHSLAAVMLLNASEVHHFSDIGYRHNSMTNCPAVKRNNCDCDPMLSVDLRQPSNSFGRCHARWTRLMRDKALAAGQP